MRRFLTLLLPIILSACAGSPRPGEPSLAPRAAERIDPRVPVPDTSGNLPASAELQAQLGGLLASVRAAQSASDAAIAAAEAAANRAGARLSEGWVQAQQQLSAAIAARNPVTRGLSDIDATVSRAVQQQGGLVPADLADVRSAAEEAATIDRRQAERIEAVEARLR